MRETDSVANEKFNGRIREAIEYIIETSDDKKIDEFYSNEWNDRECDMADVFIARKNLGHLSLEELHHLQKDLKMSEFMSSINMTEEEILTCKVNPFIIKITKNIVVMLGIITISFLIGWLLEKVIMTSSSMDYIGFVKWVILISITPISIKLGNYISSYFRFEKVKKELMFRK